MGPMRTPYDQFGKQMLRAVLDQRGLVETDAEVPADPRRVDLWFVPDDSRRPGWVPGGLLGRITAGPTTLELFHDTPGGDTLAACFVKHGQFRHYLSRREPAPPIPTQWIISSGRPVSGIEGLWLRPITGWPAGVYEGPPLLWTRLVVVSELPVTRDTLLVRLLGAGRVLRQAIADLKALEPDALERRLALPILVRLCLAVPADPTQRTTDDQEFLMDTEDIVEAWRQEAIREGFQQGERTGFQQGERTGFQQGERAVLLRQLRRRFGTSVDSAIELRVAVASAEQIELWTERVLSAATLAELFAD
jgi:hypothetical protein